MAFDVDQELNAAIVEAARSENVPVARVRNFIEDAPLPIQWGTLTPLCFLGAAFSPLPRIVVANAGTLHAFRGQGASHVGHFGQEIPRHAYVRFGRAVQAAAARIGRRIAFVASVDLGHRHTPEGPFGFDPASAEHDAAVVRKQAVRINALDRLLAYDRD